MAISIGLIFSSQKRGPLNNFEWSWLGIWHNGRRTSQNWNCQRVTNKHTHTQTIHDHGFWMRWRILLIGKDVSMVPFIDLMILTWLFFVSGVFIFSLQSLSFFSKPLCFIFWWGTSDIKHCSPNHKPIKIHPWMMDCPALPRFKFTAPGEKATHFTPQWWPCCFSTWAVWFFFWKRDLHSKE